MIDFSAIAREAAAKKAAQSPASPVVRETVRVTPVSGARYLLKEDAEWAWEELRDYVTGQIETFHGPQIRNAIKEKAIFSSFLTRWADKAPAIARFAFEVQRGMWNRAPVSVNHFTKGADQWFAQPISERL